MSCKTPVRFTVDALMSAQGEWQCESPLLPLFVKSAKLAGFSETGVRTSDAGLNIMCQLTEQGHLISRQARSGLDIGSPFVALLGITSKTAVAAYFGHRKEYWHVYPPTFVMAPNMSKEIHRLADFIQEANRDSLLRGGSSQSPWLFKPTRAFSDASTNGTVVQSSAGQGIIVVEGSRNVPEMALARAREVRAPILVQRVIPQLDRIAAWGGPRVYHLRFFVAVSFVAVSNLEQITVAWAPESASYIMMAGPSANISQGFTSPSSRKELITNFHNNRDLSLIRPTSDLLQHFKSSGRLHTWRQNMRSLRELLRESFEGSLKWVSSKSPTHRGMHSTRPSVGMLGCDVMFTAEAQPAFIECNPDPGFDKLGGAIEEQNVKAFAGLLGQVLPGCANSSVGGDMRWETILQ